MPPPTVNPDREPKCQELLWPRLKGQSPVARKPIDIGDLVNKTIPGNGPGPGPLRVIARMLLFFTFPSPSEV